MGRGGNDTVPHAELRGITQDPDGYNVIIASTPGDIGSEAHRSRLEAYARSRLARSDISLTLSHFCAACRHEYEDHSNHGCRGDASELSRGGGCGCNKYHPGGGSFTDMRGNITIQSDVPPDGSLPEREIAMRGLLRHELCHEIYTDQGTFDAFVEELKKMNGDGKEITAKQLKMIWNILEDGMIEERERYLNPGSYTYISGLNRVYPRVGKTTTLEEDMRVPAPEGYTAEDARGNPLTNVIEEEDPMTGEMRKVLIVPAGTEISPWGEKPLSLQQQAEAALLAEAVPEFEPGALHPDVQAALDECMDDIDLAVRGNSADCIARAYEVHKVMRKHGLMREDLTDEEREMIQELSEAMGQLQATAPEGDPGQGQGQGQGGGQGPLQPANGMPPSGGGDGEMSDELREQLESGQSGGGKPGEEEGEEGGSGGGENSKKGDDKSEGQGDSSGSSDNGDSSQNSKDGSGGQRQPQVDSDGKVAGQEGQEGPSQGGGDAYGGHDPSAPLPKSAREDAEKSGRGRMSDEQLKEALRKAEKDLEGDSKRQSASDKARVRKGQIEANEYQLPDNQRAVSQSDITKAVRNQGAKALPQEQGELQKLGRKLSRRLDKIKHESIGSRRYQRRGTIDPRRLTKVMNFDDRVFEQRGRKMDVDLEIDISIDRSGSVTGDADANTNQYRMAKMCAYAAKTAKVPISIYGWSGDGGWTGARHFAYKESHSDDVTGVDGLFQTGGGSTPTAEGIGFSRARLRRSKAGQKVMVVVTDGAANDVETAREQVERARKDGIKVVGLAFGLGSGVSAESMDSTFGRDNWKPIAEYTDAPGIVASIIEKAARESTR
jgi:hypothetical protein